MKTFYLRLKNGDILSKIDATTKEIAISYFSQIKRLDEKDLVKIYTISE